MERLVIILAVALVGTALAAGTAQAASPTCDQARSAVYNRLTNSSNEIRYVGGDTAFAPAAGQPNFGFYWDQCGREPANNRTYIHGGFTGRNFAGYGSWEEVRVSVYVGGTDRFISCNGTTYSMPLGRVTYTHDHAGAGDHGGSFDTSCE